MQKQKWMAALLCAALTLGLAACGADKGEQNGDAPVPPVQGEDMGVMEAYTPAPMNMTPEAEEKYPYMGVTLRLPEKLLAAILEDKVFMYSGEDLEYTDLTDLSGPIPADWYPTPENMPLHSGYIEFTYLPENMREEVPSRKTPMTYDQFTAWIAEAQPMARLDMVRAEEFAESALTENGYARRVKLGEHGGYVYILSVNEAPADGGQEAQDLFAALPELERNITLSAPKAPGENYFGITTPEVQKVERMGDFSAQTLDGSPVDQSIFAKKKLTMVNLWTTWCTACVSEMPDLEELSKALVDTDAQIISICCDTSDARGEVDQELLELAGRIVEKTGVTFPTLVPDKTLQEGVIKGLMAYPTTFFVDSEGNVVGEPVLGSNDKDGWMQVIQERLAEVQ